MELEDNGIGDVIEMRGSVEAGPFLIGWTKESYDLFCKRSISGTFSVL